MPPAVYISLRNDKNCLYFPNVLKKIKIYNFRESVLCKLILS